LDERFEGGLPKQIEEQELEKGEKALKAFKTRHRWKSIWKGVKGGLLVFLLPVWAAVIFTGFALANELIPIRFRPKE
jgi:hypothetical protein